MECEFQNPVNYLGELPSEGEYWHWRNYNCQFSEIELIQNTETGAEFYINKTLSYGDLILIIILAIFLIFGIFKFVWNFIQQNWNFKI